MMIERTADATFLNRVVNDPSVYPHVRGLATGPLDLQPMLQNDGVVALMGQHGGCVAVRQQLGLYEIHTQVLPEGRGEWTKAMAQDVLHWLFTRTDAVELWTKAPQGNVAAFALARAIGGRQQFVAKNGWIADGAVVPATIFSLSVQDWMTRAPSLVERGHWFHETLESEYARVGYAEPVHPEDEAHDRYVGAAVEMFMGGQPMKGMVFYNRFAAMAGYAPCTIVGTDPLRVDIHDAVLELHGQHFFVASIESKVRH